MNASVFCCLTGTSGSTDAFSKEATSGPCGSMQLWSESPPGTKPSALASYAPWISPMTSLIVLRWNHGGRNVCSATIQRGGKITKSTLATPGVCEGEVSTVKIDGSQ